MIDCVLDHVAVAVERAADAWSRYVGDLGGEWLGGGATPGFASAQVTYANGMKLEVLEPYAVEENDFLRRFLDTSGPGPHHLTYKVPDLDAALEEARAARYDPVGIDLSDPQWQEAFLHPKQAHGVVVQLAHAADRSEEWRSPAPPGLPTAGRRPASLDHVTHTVADLDGALALFAGLLGGTTTDEGDGWIELAWPGPGRLRLVGASADHLRGRVGRIQHLAYGVADPATVPDAQPHGDGGWEVPPERNLGTGLRLHELRS